MFDKTKGHSDMCMNCFSAAEVVTVQGVAGMMFVRSGITRLREQLTGIGSLERRRRAHRSNARFLSGLGLNANLLLGPPAAPAPQPAGAALIDRLRAAGPDVGPVSGVA